MVIPGKAYGGLVTRFDFFLSLERPEFDCSGAHNNVMRYRIVSERVEDVFRTVSDSINDRLDTFVVPGVPNLDNLVCAE